MFLLFLSLLSFTLYLIAFFISLVGLLFKPSLLFGIDFFTSVYFGIALGVTMALVGIVMLRKNRNWAKSMSFIVGDSLIKGSWYHLLLASLAAGVIEEAYTRGFILVIVNYKLVTTKPALVALFILVNIAWAFNHLLNQKNDFKANPRKTFKKSLPHLSVIFVSSIPYTVLTLYFNSLAPAIIAHLTLDFVFGILYRYHK